VCAPSTELTDVLLASCRSLAACHRGAKALPARRWEGLADGEALKCVIAVPLRGEGLAGVALPAAQNEPSPEKPCMR